MNLAVLIQARMRSKRLPGKVLQQVAGKPLLGYLVERLRRTRKVETLILTTSTDPSDDAVAEFCVAAGLECYRGSLENVASRFRSACQHYKLDAFVRINGDSPLMDPEIIDHAVKLFKTGEWDLVTNVQERTFPRGQSVEVLRCEAFERAFEKMTTPDHLEHVTGYFYDNPNDFKIQNFRADGSFSDVRFVVDTLADLSAFEGVVERMQKPQWEYGWKDLLQLYKETASWLRTPLG